ncbi:hypothetical protein SCLARK_001230 [Spiroplasma clarkii]|uniref:Nucleotidyltransferase n=1 Tax=Spiroplasma clarkii TaxID=2139 RepID=A0A1Y0L197_9MOLU|nr:hypothetical protein [Spiroplasma clarkii]ARU91782.1 hypothetical protein SCLARK_001230 [Spiroplasma clarkii]ATX71149.1 hypothetical protein SCLAR_v1c08410 [Spiroplasma clarkii]
MGHKYEYITKSELKPVRVKIEKVINELQKKLKEVQITFQFHLIGSGKRTLVTRLVGENREFDLDYNFYLQKFDENIEPKEIRSMFIKSLNEIVIKHGFEYVSDGGRAIKLKLIDKKNKTITYSCDFAIMYEDIETEKKFILEHVKVSNKCVWEEEKLGRNYDDKVSNIIANGLWIDVRREYLNLKENNNKQDKQSFSLYYEAVNNIYNKYDWK